MTVKRRFEISIIAGLIFTVLLSMVKFEANCAEIKEKVLRLHIIANSDSVSDQTLKIKVRNKILKLNIYDEAKTKEDAIVCSKENINYIIEEAEKVIKEEGFNYNVSAQVKTCYFDTRVYEDFTLPAGNYEALQIKIGKAKGKNWWCVIFPKLCLGACSDFGNEISESSKNAISNSENYQVRFKIVEIFEDLKDSINTFF